MLKQKLNGKSNRNGRNKPKIRTKKFQNQVKQLRNWAKSSLFVFSYLLPISKQKITEVGKIVGHNGRL